MKGARVMGADIAIEHALARRLTQTDIDKFLAEGISAQALARSWCRDWSFIGRERVSFDGAGRFEFERHHPDGAVNAHTLLVFDEAGDPADIYAFRPGARGLWLGAVDMLGQEQALAPRLDEQCLDVWPDVIPWLAAERRGVVLINPARALSTLRLASPLRVQTVNQGTALRDTLRSLLPRIVVRDRPAETQDAALVQFA